MDMQTSAMPPIGPTLTVDEDALASQVLEIIGGIRLEALQTLEEPEERDVWSVEEGDDSVFYSDEDIIANASCDQGAGGSERLIVTADEPIPQEENDQGDKSVPDKGDSERKEATPNEQVEERREIQTPKTESMDQPDSADPGQSNQAPEKSVSTCNESLQVNCTSADVQTQPEQNLSAETVNIPVKEVPNTQTADLQTFDAPNEEGIKRLNAEPEGSEQMSSAQLQISSDRELQLDHVPIGFHQNSSPGYSTLPLLKKSFNHLTSAKYSTVSYRKIRRGNTRQKIETFEYMLMNL